MDARTTQSLFDAFDRQQARLYDDDDPSAFERYRVNILKVFRDKAVGIELTTDHRRSQS